MPGKQISVIVPTHNHARYLELTLKSLAVQTMDPQQWEVIVINNGSSDNTSGVCERFAARSENVSIVQLDRANRSVARNAGIERASGAWTIFLDDDCLAPANLLEAHRVACAANPDAALIGTRREVLTLIPDDHEDRADVQYQAQMFGLNPLRATAVAPENGHLELHKNSIAPTDLHGGTHWDLLRRIGSGSSVCPWVAFMTSHCGAPAARLRELGGFSTRFEGWGEEDPELGFRLSEAGVPFVVLFDAPVYHQIHPRKNVQWDEWLRNYKMFVDMHPVFEVLTRWKMVLGAISEEEYEAAIRAYRDLGEPRSILSEARSAFDRFLSTCDMVGGLSAFLELRGDLPESRRM